MHALKGVDLSINKGETHCLAGENGCGKSTIIKVISGFYQPDGGTIEGGWPTLSPHDANQSINAGIQVIYQDFSVFPNLTVRENLAFNQVLAKQTQAGALKANSNGSPVRRHEKINFNVDLNALVETLPVADKQLIAISRALMADAKADYHGRAPPQRLPAKRCSACSISSPTCAKRVAVLFVSHKLEEMFEICENITIMRNGENVVSCPMSDLDNEKFTFYRPAANSKPAAARKP